jgi:hypothetical protein
MTLTELQKEVGSLSQPSKMPCHGYSIPAKACNVGSKLREITNSVCSKCYALKNRYAFNNVQSAMNKRLASLSRNVDKWERNLTELINRKEKSGYFRWHDSGDLQSKEHLTAINNIAKSLSHIKFWLPTRERSLVGSWTAQNKLNSNLTIRLSASIIGTGLISPTVGNYTINTSSVGWDKSKFHCPAPKQGNACGSCRACWDREIPNTNYHLH